ncbi:MAG: sigma-54-dependent transcriptional regulator [Candidatus Aminicenantaceae bacterium]
MEKILVVDDEKSILDLLKVAFKKEGWRVSTCLSAQRALELIENNDIDLIVCDIKMPQISGIQILKHVKKKKPDIPVVMITAYASINQAVEALRAGAMDYVVKPFDIDELKITVSHGLEQRKLRQENILLKKELKRKHSLESMIGKSRKMMEVCSLIEKIADTDSTVLVSGESGTGKEIAAKSIHHLSYRRENQFVSINCGALPENLLESELFGHTRGSFTGAVADKKGMFEVAHKGTLFLDEIGETSAWTQVKLLRALQEKRIRRIGSTEEIPIDARIIAATNQDLKKKIREGAFREDLFYRLNIISFEMPPLREHTEDLPLLVTHFIKKYCFQMGKKIKRVSPEVMNIFESYYWPGNVRELENIIERAIATEESDTIKIDSLPKELVTSPQRKEPPSLLNKGFNLTSYLDGLSQNFIKQARLTTGGNLRKTASLLGISYRSLRYLIDKYGLKSKANKSYEEKERE